MINPEFIEALQGLWGLVSNNPMYLGLTMIFAFIFFVLWFSKKKEAGEE